MNVLGVIVRFIYPSTPLYVSAMEYCECCVHMCRLQSAQAELNKVQAQLKEKQEKLAAIEAKVKPAAPCAYAQICMVLVYCVNRGHPRSLYVNLYQKKIITYLHPFSLLPTHPYSLTCISLPLLPHLSLLSLPSLHRQIADLQASYERSVAEKEELTRNIEKTQARLDRAAKLTTGLADEQIRWAESVKVSLHPLQGGREFYC